MAALDWLQAVQAEFAGLCFDVLTGPEVLTVKARLETLSRQQAAVADGDDVDRHGS